MRYHPRIAHTYTPNLRMRVQGKNGGYLVQTNEMGFRSDHSFCDEVDTNKFRVLLFGDSQTAGDGISNAYRYSDRLEALFPDLVVNNYAVAGTGTDQHFLTYQENRSTPHDLVVIGLYVENILRITKRVIRARDSMHNVIFRAKPFFTLESSRLELHNVPVPKESWTAENIPLELRNHVFAHEDANFLFRSKSKTRHRIVRFLSRFGRLRHLAKRIVSRFRKYEPFPEYDSSTSHGWTLMREILKTWVSSSAVPVLIVTLPHSSALVGLSNPKNYQKRFRELSADLGCEIVDPLPDFLKMHASERQKLWSDDSGHFSARGHQAITDLLAPAIRRLIAKPRVTRSSRH